MHLFGIKFKSNNYDFYQENTIDFINNNLDILLAYLSFFFKKHPIKFNFC